MRPIDLERRARCAAELLARYPDQADTVLAALDANPSAALPYHGTPHMLVVALACLELAAGEGLAEEATGSVFLAALFHDYDYAGDRDDTVNVARAVGAARTHLSFPGAEAVPAIIEATCFPYSAPAADPLQGVIRDADVLFSTLLIPDAHHFRMGLFTE